MSNGPEAFLDRGGVIGDGGATIMSRATYFQSIGLSPDGKPLSVTARFDQGEWWRTRDGRWLRIAEMEPGHRYNTAAMLMRTAPMQAFRYAMGWAGIADGHDGGDMAHDALERIADDVSRRAVADPRGWLRETALYRALTAGLKVKGDGTGSWQTTGRDPVTGKKTKVPPRLPKVCPLNDCGCSGEAHA
jgi:hypothetical protein